jgi:1,2-diacylglycerol 3-beta-galactosyltransferase
VGDNGAAQQIYRTSPAMPVTASHLPSRVTILLSDAGGGHRSAARSLADALEGRAHVSLLNLLDEYTPFPFNRFSSSYGPWVNHAPGLWSLVYRAMESRKRITIGERSAYPLVRRRLRSVLAETQPDLVISVHPLLTGVPLRILREVGNPAPFVTVVTDPVSVHPAWFCPKVDLCTVATDEAQQLAISYGMNPDRVQVIGLPVRRAFWDPRDQPKTALRAKLGLNHLPMVLLTGGGAGIGNVLPMAQVIARRLAESGLPAQMVIIAGRNVELLRQLQSCSWPIPVTPLGFVDAMADWLAASDLLISKAGPGTLAEAACLGVPVLVTGYIPGQEEGNIRWLMTTGAGTFAQDPEKVAALVAEWLEPGNPTLTRMADHARSVARPHAALDIAQRALSLCSANRL